MLVVADSSPLHYLILIGQANLLQTLYSSVKIPNTVASELSHESAPQLVRDFIANRPQWLTVQAPQNLLSLEEIDEGECAAISLAIELGADLLLIDDLDGRRVAIEHRLKITGVVGILLEASERGLIELRPTVNDLVNAGLYLSKDLLNRLLGKNE
jgi:predicted nucleic acid-binding protein